MRKYMQLYLTTDVCLLADVFENFRATCHEAYELDPAYFVSAPQLAWNANCGEDDASRRRSWR